jgi:hypothetical protein
MKMMLYVQRNKLGKQADSPAGIAVDFNFDRNGEAQCFELESQRLIARLIRAKIDIAGADGMIVSGLEKDGYDRKSEVLRYQEWWLTCLK